MTKQSAQSDRQRAQQVRIAALRRQIQEAAGEEVLHGVSPDCPPDVEEVFLQQVLAFEQIGASPLFEQLVELGVQLPAPRELADDELAPKLQRIFDVLARLGVYVQSTDHLSDRELYELLWNDTLREPETTVPENPNITCLIDLVATGSHENVQTWLTYYASEEDRAAWRADFPDAPVPPPKKRPHDRDRNLPQWPPDSVSPS